MSFKLLSRKIYNKLFRRNQEIYTTDGLSNHIENWNEWLAEFKHQPNLRFLEIGSFEGRATRWLLDNILTHSTATICCIDTFEGGMEIQVDMDMVKQNFYHNIMPHRKKVSVFCDPSQEVIRANPNLFPPDYFDFIYIDGSHKACDVLEDIILSFRTLKSGGLMVFDDYEWKAYQDPKLNPKLAIDSWLACFDGQYDLIYKNWQLCVRKKSD